MNSTVNVTRAVGRRTVRHMLATPAGIIPSLVPPLFFLAAFAGGLSRLTAVPHFDYRAGYTSFAYGFAFVQAATLAGVFTGFGVARDFDTGFARRLLVSAPARGGIITGYLGASVVRWAITEAVVTVAAVVAGASIRADLAQLLALGLIGLAANLIAALWACGTAMFLRTEQAGSLIQLPVFLALFLAPVYAPLGLITGWVHAVASINPATALLDSTRGLIAAQPQTTILTIALLAAGLVLSAIWARRGLTAAERAATR